jgi:hypothetical protein
MVEVHHFLKSAQILVHLVCGWLTKSGFLEWPPVRAVSRLDEADCTHLNVPNQTRTLPTRNKAVSRELGAQWVEAASTAHCDTQPSSCEYYSKYPS